MILDPLFMVVFKFGVVGAALATLLSKLPPAVVALISLLGKKNLIYLDFNNFMFEKDKLKDIRAKQVYVTSRTICVAFFVVWSNNEYDFPHACALMYA